MTGAVLGRRWFRDHRRGLIGWSLGVVLLISAQLAAYPSVRDSGGYEDLLKQYPEALKAVFGITGGASLASPAGYLQAEMFGFMLPMLLVIYALILATDAIAGEEERHLLDLVLAQPVRRSRVVLERAGTIAAMSAAVGVAAWVALMTVGAAVGLGLGAGRLAGAVVLVVALSWAMGAVGLLAGCVTGHRGLSAGIGGAVAVGGFLLESLAPLSTAIERFRWLSPFHYAMGGRALERGLRWADLAALVGLSLVLVAGSAWALDRRDVEG